VNEDAGFPASGSCAFSGLFRVFVQVFDIAPLFFKAGGLFRAGLHVCSERLELAPRHGGGVRRSVQHAVAASDRSHAETGHYSSREKLNSR
jgi:hypothetical protein